MHANPKPGARNFFRVSHMGAGSQSFGQSLNAFPGHKRHKRGAGWKVELQELEPAPIWDPSAFKARTLATRPLCRRVLTLALGPASPGTPRRPSHNQPGTKHPQMGANACAPSFPSLCSVWQRSSCFSFLAGIYTPLKEKKREIIEMMIILSLIFKFISCNNTKKNAVVVMILCY